MDTVLSKQFVIAGARSDETINSGAIISFDAVCVGSPFIIMLQKIKKQVKGKFEILSSIRDHKKSRETREVAYTSRY